MTISIAVLLVAVGVLAAFAGAELISRGLAAVGRGPLLFVGALAAAAAATAPEVLFAARAAWDGAPSMVLGLVTGSLVANALLAAPLAAGGANEPPSRISKALALWTALGALGVGVFAFDGQIDRIEGSVMILGALAAAAATAMRARGIDDRPRQPLWASVAGLLAGAVLLLFGTAAAVDGAVRSPLTAAAGGLLTGLVLFGLATALPELAAAAFASRRNEGTTGLGNVVAGTAMSVFGATGAAALTRPLQVDADFMGFPAAALVASAVMLAVLVLAGGRLPKWSFAVSLLIYFAFLGFSARLLT